MRFRPLRRRLAHAPRLMVRAHTPWPLRLVVGALALGFSAALALWAFDYGRSITGLDTGARAQLQQLRLELEQVRAQRDRQETRLNTADSILATERAMQTQLQQQVQRLELDNRDLREDLGFFQHFVPNSGKVIGPSIRSLQAVQKNAGLDWRLLLVNPNKNAPEQQAQVIFSLTGEQGGKPWQHRPEKQFVKFTQYHRVQGHFPFSQDVRIEKITVTLVDATGRTLATESITLP